MATSRRASDFKDPRDVPAYTIAEAARFIRLPAATLRTWVLPDVPTGTRSRRAPTLIRPASIEPPLLSFWNLVEGHVARSLRSRHGVSLQKLRAAIRYAEQKLGIERLLLSQDLSTEAGRVFIEHYSKLIELSASGQIVLQEILNRHLKRVEWDTRHLPIRLHPWMTATGEEPDRGIVIDPTIGFGRPTIEGAGISTVVIAERVDAGETPADVAKDYHITEEAVRKALIYERAA